MLSVAVLTAVLAKTAVIVSLLAVMKAAKKGNFKLRHVESAASSAVKTACDVGAKAIVVLSESGETARYVAKFHPDAPIVCVMEDKRKRIGEQIEGVRCRPPAAAADVRHGCRAPPRPPTVAACHRCRPPPLVRARCSLGDTATLAAASSTAALTAGD